MSLNKHGKPYYTYVCNTLKNLRPRPKGPLVQHLVFHSGQPGACRKSTARAGRQQTSPAGTFQQMAFGDIQMCHIVTMNNNHELETSMNLFNPLSKQSRPVAIISTSLSNRCHELYKTLYKCCIKHPLYKAFFLKKKSDLDI